MGGRDHSVECEQCGHYRGGLNDLRCDCDEHDLFGEWATQESLATLAHNLATAAGLCAAFRCGFDEGWNVTGEGFNSEYTGKRFKWPADYEDMATNGGTQADEWRPGCKRSAP